MKRTEGRDGGRTFNGHGKRTGVTDNCFICKREYTTYRDGQRVSNVCQTCREKLPSKGE